MMTDSENAWDTIKINVSNAQTNHSLSDPNVSKSNKDAWFSMHNQGTANNVLEGSS